MEDFVSSRMSRESNGLQNPVVDRDNPYAEIRFPVPMQGRDRSMAW